MSTQTSEYQDYKLESHTTFGAGIPTVEVQLQDKDEEWHAIKITKKSYRVVIDYVLNPETELNPGVSNTIGSTYQEAFEAVKPRIKNADDLLPDKVRRTAFRLLQLGWYLEETSIDKYQPPRSYGINPLRPSTQRYVIADVSGLAGRYTGPVIIGFDSPVPSSDKVKDRIKMQIAATWNSQYLTSERRHAYGIESDEDLRNYISIEERTSTDSIDEAHRIRDAMREGEYLVDEMTDDDGNVENETVDVQSSKQATLTRF